MRKTEIKKIGDIMVETKEKRGERTTKKVTGKYQNNSNT